MPLEHIETKEVLTDELAQELIRQTIERDGKFILNSPVAPEIGEIRDYAGLPFRVVRLVSFEEAAAHHEATKVVWPSAQEILPDPDDFYFEVVVAD